jgi:hypothetical protein
LACRVTIVTQDNICEVLFLFKNWRKDSMIGSERLDVFCRPE